MPYKKIEKPKGMMERFFEAIGFIKSIEVKPYRPKEFVHKIPSQNDLKKNVEDFNEKLKNDAITEFYNDRRHGNNYYASGVSGATYAGVGTLSTDNRMFHVVGMTISRY